MARDFERFIGSLKNTIQTWEFFVNWTRVFEGKADLEIVLNKLNYLLGKQDVESEFRTLYSLNPDIVKAFPLLIAVRGDRIEVYDDSASDSRIFRFSPHGGTVEDYVGFLQNTGLIKIFQSGGVKNLVDYVLGVEVGLDSNGRKNRSGATMEKLVGDYLNVFAESRQLKILSHANSSKMSRQWDVRVDFAKSERSFDFAVFNQHTRKLRLFETNFYNGGGSKLKAVCGEFMTLNAELKMQGIDFVWITDGGGWLTTKRPLEEAFRKIDHIYNLRMLEEGILSELDW